MLQQEVFPSPAQNFLGLHGKLAKQYGNGVDIGFRRFYQQVAYAKGEQYLPPPVLVLGLTRHDGADNATTVEYQSTASVSSVGKKIDLRSSRHYVIPPITFEFLIDLRCGVCGRPTLSGRVTQTRRTVCIPCRQRLRTSLLK